jgi:nucleoside-diphosphate-sugar epimerase
MKVLIAGAGSRLGQAVASELMEAHQLRLFDSEMSVSADQEEHERIEGDILDLDTCWKLVRGVDAVILPGHGSGSPLLGSEPEQQLDLATRGTHILLKAAVEAGVKRIIYAGTLEIFGSYPNDVYISEHWEPRPTPAMEQMAPYLAEKVCLEFARAHKVTVTVLRLGKVIREEEVADRQPDLMWLDIRDAARAFGWALSRDSSQDVEWTRRFALYHICAAIPNAKYLVSQAASKGFEPLHNFEACWTTSGTGVNGGDRS